MKKIIQDLYKMNRCLLGEGYDSALQYINHLIPLDILTYPSGTKVGTWKVPQEWVVRDAWVKYKGRKIIDYKKQPLSLVVGSLPFEGTVTLEELQKHLHYSAEQPDEYLYEYKFYEKDWGFTLPLNKMFKKDGDEWKSKLKEGDYEVFIDTEYVPGEMKIGVHTIKGQIDREILLFAHLDHPYQANDNLSGVAILIDLVKKLKVNHTVKLIFCPETIGSIAYAHSEDISKVDAVIALDAVGNTMTEGILLQKSFDKENRLNDAAALALRGIGVNHRQGLFRSTIGSDEYVFNDPYFEIPGIMFSTHPYPEYHTSADTPKIINEETLEKVQQAVIKTIEYYEKDYVPTRLFTGPLFRSKYGIQTSGKQTNLSWDYFFYAMDGEKTLSQLCVDFGFNFEYVLEKLEPLIQDEIIGVRPADSKGYFFPLTGEEPQEL